MDKCKICKNNDADKKGSHIVPHFLLKRIENIDGKTDRDYEIGYKIERLKSKSHFGRSVQPEILEDLFGQITDDDISNNRHPLIVDNFFCSECEGRLSKIESEYAITIENKGETEYESGINSAIGILFWGSVLWRMSINGESGVKLNSEQNEILRKVLDIFLPKKNEQLDEKTFAVNELVKTINYRLLRCKNCNVQEAKLLVFHPDFYNSLCLFIDEYVLTYSLNGQYDEIKEKDCFGINELILQAPINGNIGKEIIKPFDDITFREINTTIVNKIKDVYIEGLFEFFDKVHIEAGGQGDKMPFELKQEIMAEITSDEKKIGRKYTQDEIVKSTYKVLKKYAP